MNSPYFMDPQFTKRMELIRPESTHHQLIVRRVQCCEMQQLSNVKPPWGHKREGLKQPRRRRRRGLECTEYRLLIVLYCTIAIPMTIDDVH